MENLLPYLIGSFLLLLATAGVLLLLLSRFYKVKAPRSPYTAVPILTPAEIRFFSLLESTLPEHCYLLTQVRLANLVAIRQGFSWKQFAPIGMKSVDFVICNRRDMRPLLVVELDDRTHDRPERKERDRFVDQVLGGVAIPILHWPLSRGYSRTEIAQEVRRMVQMQA
jgi:very-short-patch-repair endonuclease